MAGTRLRCARWRPCTRAGAGLTTIASPRSIVPILQTIAPCAMCVPLPGGGRRAHSRCRAALLQALEGKACVAADCGLSTRCASGVIRDPRKRAAPRCLTPTPQHHLEGRVPQISAHRQSSRHAPSRRGERLLERDLTDPISDSRALNAMSPAVILKGASSVIASDRGTFISASGCPGMAKGGSGDALTGISGRAHRAGSRAGRRGVLPERAAWACGRGRAGGVWRARHAGDRPHRDDLRDRFVNLRERARGASRRARFSGATGATRSISPTRRATLSRARLRVCAPRRRAGSRGSI